MRERKKNFEVHAAHKNLVFECMLSEVLKK